MEQWTASDIRLVSRLSSNFIVATTKHAAGRRLQTVEEDHALSRTLAISIVTRFQRSLSRLSCFLPVSREPVVLRVSIVVRGPPLRCQLSILFHLAEGGKQRPGIDLKPIRGQLREPLRNAVTVQRFPVQDCEDQ